MPLRLVVCQAHSRRIARRRRRIIVGNPVNDSFMIQSLHFDEANHETTQSGQIDLIFHSFLNDDLLRGATQYAYEGQG